MFYLAPAVKENRTPSDCLTDNVIPLGHLYWWAVMESNHPHYAYQAYILTTELTAHVTPIPGMMVEPVRIELTFHALQARAMTTLAQVPLDDKN